MDVRIGVVHAMKEIEIELPADTDPAQVRADVDAALDDEDNILWLTDRHGRQIAVPSRRIAYVEVGTQDHDRHIGFGA